jgi:DNA adenine methylase
MQRLKYEEDAVFFIDPPYTKAAKRLYSHWEFDHERLFQLAESLAGDIIMTYDNTQEIKELATAHGFQTAEVAMKNTHHAKMTELIIGKNLQWLDPDA